MSSRKKEEEAEVRCSFCGKSDAEVATIIVHGSVGICDECVVACQRILAWSAMEDSRQNEELLKSQGAAVSQETSQ